MSVLGMARLRRQLTVDIPKSVRKAARDALALGASELVDEMRRLVPVDKGDLRDSIGWTFGSAPAGSLVLDTMGGGKDLKVTVYAGGRDAFYAWFQEFGTKNMSPNPYFFPSYRKLKRRIKSRITRNINKAIRAL